MASEITASASLRFQKGAKNLSFSKSGLRFDVSGDHANFISQLVGTTEEALLLGDVAPGWVLIFNTDNTNFVSIRRATGEGNCIKIKAGEFALFRFEATAPFVIADTDPVNIEIMLVDD